jgi:predicted ATPase/DNA-binding SARP family transcriptional activator
MSADRTFVRKNHGVLFGILGPVRAWSPDGGEIAVGGPRQRSLLAALLLDAGRVVGPDRLIDLLYGDDAPADAANALQSQVSRLRRTVRSELASAANGIVAVEFSPAGYRIAVDPDEVDAHRFDRLARDGRAALTSGDYTRAAELLGAALRLWRGPALADVTLPDGLASGLAERRIAAQEDRADAELALGRHAEVLDELQKLVADHPLDERARALLMRALYAAGRQADALAVFEDGRRILADELGADPSAELADVHLAILRADSGPVARLPAQLTSFVGRDEELRKVGKLLAAGRLVTLTGPGGAGKTRLAVESAGHEPGEVYFVDLSAARDGEAIAQTVSGVLGLRENALLPGVSPAQSADPGARLAAALADRRLLLVLDNCEQVIDAAAALVQRLLAGCPGLRILATSREPLQITGEALFGVPQLRVPEPGADLLEIAQYPAVRLFLDRASGVRPDFELTADNADSVLRICAALDGLPLAIELAAARLRTLPVDQVAARLDDRFGLLSRGDRTKAARHQTLRAVVEWSWELLGEAERDLAARFTVFAGGASAAAVARVCEMPEGQAIDLLADLVDKSLVDVVGERYRMLDTIRAFCAERLGSGDCAQRRPDGIEAAHAAYFTGFAETAEPHLIADEQLDWLARLTAEHANLIAALHWAVRADRTLALRLIAALAPYFWLRGLRGEAVGPAAELLADLDGPPDGMAEEYVLCVLTAIARGRRSDHVEAHVDRAGAIMNVPVFPPRHPYVTVLWAVTMGPPDEMRDVESIEIGDDPWSWGLTHLGRGFHRLYSGDRAGAEDAFEQSVAGFREAGDRWGMAQALDQLAGLADWRGDRTQALGWFDAALDLIGQLGAAEDLADLYCRRGDLLIRAGATARAEADYRRALELAARVGSTLGQANARRGLAEISRLNGDFAESRRLYEKTLASAAGDWANSEIRSRIHTALGRIAVVEGDSPRAREQFDEALATIRRPLNLPAAASAVEGMAGLVLAENEPERAARLLGAGEALRGSSVPGDPDVAEVAAAARAELGAAAYDRAYQAGAALTADEVLRSVAVSER